MSRSRFVKVSALVAGATLALAGCSFHPGAAAVVDGQTITNAQVDHAAAALCAVNIEGAKQQGQPKPQLASRGARQAALQFLIDAELSKEFGQAKGVVPSQAEVSNAITQNQQSIDMLPPDERASFTELLRGYTESRLILRDIGRQKLGASAADEQAVAAGTSERQKWAKSVDVSVDPRYGTWSKQTLSPTSGSLSIPVSQRATGGASSNPSADWVAGLPVSQTCG